MRKAQSLSGDDKAGLNGRVRQLDNPVVVKSGFALDSRSHEQIRSLVATAGQPHRTVTFETNPDLICGIEVFVDGHKLAWSVTDYLAQSEAAIHQNSGISPASVNQHAVTNTD